VGSYQLTGRPPSAIELHRDLNAQKKTELPWLYEVSKCAPQEALRDLERAFSNFFRRAQLKKQGKHKGRVGYPRFKSRRRGLGSFRLTGSIHAEPSRIKLPRLGWIRLKERGYLPVESDTLHILSATVSERAGRWFVSLQVEELLEAQETSAGPEIGVDLGVKTLAACSDGTTFVNPRALYSGARKLARLQKKHSRQEKGSNRREETRKRIARQHYRIACIRQDYAHKATSFIVAESQATRDEAVCGRARGPERVRDDEEPQVEQGRGRRLYAGIQKAAHLQVLLVRRGANYRRPFLPFLQDL